MKKIRVVTALALAGILCLGGASAAMAEENISTGTEEDPAQAAITKILQMPDGTVIPTMDFTFNFDKVSLDGATTDPAKNAMPGLSTTISYPPSPMGTYTPASGIVSVPVQSTNFVASKNWPHAGLYVYTLTENKPANTKVTYSYAEYTITVWVANCTSGAGCNNGLYVASLVAEKTKDDAGTPVIPAQKVIPTPGGGDGTYSKLIFVNGYLESNDGNPTVPSDHILNVSKTVTGSYGDLSKYFPFEVTVTKLSTGVSGDPDYKAYIVEPVAGGTFKVVDPAPNCLAVGQIAIDTASRS